MAVFAPAFGADFDFDALLHQAIDVERDDDIGDYAIDPVVVDGIPLPPVSPGPPAIAATQYPAAPAASKPAPSTPTAATAAGPSRHAPPKAGAAELAYRKAKGKAREKLKAQQRRDAAPYGDFAVKPRLVNKHLRRAEMPIRSTFNANDMPHASTAYVGKRDSGGAGRVFRLEELVGKGSKYEFELRKWDGR